MLLLLLTGASGTAAVTPQPVVSYRAIHSKDSPPFKGDKSYSQLKGRNPTYVDRSRQLRGITIEYGGEK